MVSQTGSHPERGRLIAFGQGRLAEGELAEIGLHLASCSACRSLVEGVPPDPLQVVLRQYRRPVVAAWDISFPPAPGYNPELPTVPDRAAPARPQTEGVPRVPGYQLAEKLGEGGMGVVWKAYQPALRRWVALKVIRDEALTHPGVRSRFRREASTLARLRHPNIVTIHDVGEWQTDERGQSLPWFSMEYVAGGTLAELWTHQPQSPSEVAQVVSQLADAMHHAHQAGVIHRDLKPGNVLLSGEGRMARDERSQESREGPLSPHSPLATHHSSLIPKITDFGLVKRIAVSSEALPASVESSCSASMSSPGIIVGTPGYMAPEQLWDDSASLGPAVDIYALGAILYEGLTGRPPFQGLTAERTLDQVLTTSPRPIRELVPRVPPDLEAICLKCLQKEPLQRYASARELDDDLKRFLAGFPVQARPVGTLELVGKWCRRQPLAALGLGCLLLGPLALLALALVFQANAAGWARMNAQERHGQASETEARKDYGVGIARAQGLWRQGLVEPTLRLLDSHRPGEGMPDPRGWEWHHLLRLCHSERQTLSGHGGPVRCLAVSADGRWIASGSDDGSLRLWDAETGRLAHSLPQSQPIRHVVFAPDSKRLAWAGRKPEIHVLELDGTGARQAFAYRGHILPVTGLAFSPDGARIFSCSEDATFQVWKADDGEDRRVHLASDRALLGLALHPQGKQIALAETGRVRLIDVATGKNESVLEIGADEIHALAFSPEGSRLALARSEGIEIRDCESGRLVSRFTGHRGPVLGLCFAPDGKHIASAGRDGTVRVWEIPSGAERQVLRGHVRAVHAVRYSPDGSRLITAGADQVLKVWEAGSSPERREMKGHEGAVRAVAFSPEGTRLLSAGEDRSLLVRDVLTGRTLCRMGRQVIQGEPGQPGRKIMTVHGHQAEVLSAAFSPDGRLVASGSADQTARLWDAQSGTELHELRHGGAAWGVAFSPDGRTLATASADGQVRLWEVATGRVRTVLADGPHPCRAVAWHRGGSLLAGLARDGMVRVWDTAMGQIHRELPGHDGEARAITFSPDGGLLLVPASRHSARLFDTSSWSGVRTLEGLTGSLTGVSFSKDGRRIATVGGTDDPLVRLWDASSGQELFTLEGGAFSVAFSSDGLRLAAGSKSGMVSLWEAIPVDGEPRRVAPYQPPGPARMARMAQGDLLVLGWFTARELPTGPDSPRGEAPPGQRYLVVVVSLAAEAFGLSEADYENFRRQAPSEAAARTAPRAYLGQFDPARFHLLRPGKGPTAATLLASWPGGEFQRTRAIRVFPEPLSTGERIGVELAWLTEEEKPGSDYRVQHEGGRAVPVGELRLR